MSNKKSLESRIKDIENQIKSAKNDALKEVLKEQKAQLVEDQKGQMRKNLKFVNEFHSDEVRCIRRLNALAKLSKKRMNAVQDAYDQFQKDGDYEAFMVAYNKLPAKTTYTTLDGKVIDVDFYSFR